MQRARMEQYVSPDRTGPMAQVNSVLHGLAQEQERITIWLEQMLGNDTAKISSDSVGQTAEVYSPEGEVIAGYNSLDGGWRAVWTKDELKFNSETNMIYLQAYRDARAEMKAAPVQPAAGMVDIRV